MSHSADSRPAGPAACPECEWSAAPSSLEDDELVRVATRFEEHMGIDHDVTWARAWETASAWLTRIVARRTPTTIR